MSNMEKHYICTGTCIAIIMKQQYDQGLKECKAPQGCTMKGHAFVKCEHCPKCNQHVPEGTVHTCTE